MGVLQTEVSRLSDFLRLCVDLLGQAGDGTAFLIGKKYLTDSIGQSPRVVFVPNVRGRLGPPTKLNANYICSWTHGCKVYVRATDGASGDEAGQFEAAEALADRVLNFIKETNPGRISFVPGNPADDSPFPDHALGADIVFEFTYTRPVARDIGITRPGMNAQPIPDPDRPHGGNGATYIPNLTAESPVRP